MRKSFDELTIADDYMFCKIMQDEEVCKTFLEMILSGKIGKIDCLSSQNAIITGAEAKSIRLDILAKDENGKTYDIEMQAVNEHNIPKRMRYYQAALDILFLDKGEHYCNLNDSYIIFLCLFDSIGKNKPVYTFESMCLEDRQTLLNDGTKKIIINIPRRRASGYVVLIRWLQSALIPFVTTRSVDVKRQVLKPPHE